MKTHLLCLALLALPGLANARCVTADDLATGITFKRNDGRPGIAISEGGGVFIDYASPATTDWQDQRSTDRGIYEKNWAWTPSDEMVVGLGPGGGYRFTIKGKPPEPTAGNTWKTSIKVRASFPDGTESGGQVLTYTVQAIYSFQAIKEAKLSGCTYRIQPVEATFTGKTLHQTRRWIYFPDLGFGLETRFTDHSSGEDRQLGLTALKPKG